MKILGHHHHHGGGGGGHHNGHSHQKKEYDVEHGHVHHSSDDHSHHENINIQAAYIHALGDVVKHRCLYCWCINLVRAEMANR